MNRIFFGVAIGFAIFFAMGIGIVEASPSTKDKGGGVVIKQEEMTELVEEHTWRFTAAGFFPKHLPDAYTGEVVLADLDLADIPDEVQGVWYYDDLVAGEWIFWIPGIGGSLTALVGGTDYSVSISGPCRWVIPLPPRVEQVVIGGLTVRLMCDNVGVCVQEVPESLAEGILLIAPATLQFLAERNYEVWVYPELYDPKTGEYQDPAGSVVNGRSYSDHCTIHPFDYMFSDKTVIHELGHALDRKLGWVSCGDSSSISDFEAIVSQEQYYGPRILEDVTYGGVVELWANQFQSIFLQKSGLADFCVHCPQGCDYIRQVAENPRS